MRRRSRRHAPFWRRSTRSACSARLRRTSRLPEWTRDPRRRRPKRSCKSKDLRLLAHLATAVLRTDGLPAFAETLTIASRWLELYWRDTYPRIDEDAIFRRNALNCFADPIAVIDGVRRAPLVSSPQHGTYSLRDVEIAGAVSCRPTMARRRLSRRRVDAAFAAASHDDLARLQGSVAGALAALARIDTRMSEGGVNASPGFAPLRLAAREDRPVAAKAPGAGRRQRRRGGGRRRRRGAGRGHGGGGRDQVARRTPSGRSRPWPTSSVAPSRRVRSR